MAAANGDRDKVLQKSRDLKFLTGFETKVRRHCGSRIWCLSEGSGLLNTGGVGELLICTGGLWGGIGERVLLGVGTRGLGMEAASLFYRGLLIYPRFRDGVKGCFGGQQ